MSRWIPKSSNPDPDPYSGPRPRGFPLGRFLGIPVYIDATWLIIFFLLSVATSRYFREEYPLWLPVQHWFAGIVTCLLFFTCVFLHEMGHSVVARAFGIPVLSITLFVFGGVAQIRREPRKAWHEFFIAIAGPLTSVALGSCFFLVFFLIEGGIRPGANGPSMAGSILSSLGLINFMLAVFNMIPGFPLDGGRVLRSAVWAVSGRFDLATRVAAGMGVFIAYFFIAGGLYVAFFLGRTLDGVWIACIGAFLLFAARRSVMQLATVRAMEGLCARDILEPNPLRVSAGMSVRSLVDGPVLRQGFRTFIVEDNGTMRGLITMNEIKATQRDEWDVTPLQSIMIPAHRLAVAEPDAPLQVLMSTMEARGLEHIPIVDGDRVVGMVSRDGVMRVLRNRMELDPR